MKSLIISLIFSICSGCATNPITGQKEFIIISETQELAIGQQYAPEIEKQMGGRIENESLGNYIDSIGQKIVRVSHRQDLDYHFTAVNDKTINAFALPGGYIFITRGMLENLQSESQLASILAHEVTHVVARDSANVMSNQIGISILLSSVTSEETSQSVLLVTDMTNQILGLRYSREDEYTADLGGLDYMIQAGYNPYAMVETMQILHSQEKSRPIEFFSTHPSPQNRIEYIIEEIEDSTYNIKGLKDDKESYRNFVLENLNP